MCTNKNLGTKQIWVLKKWVRFFYLGTKKMGMKKKLGTNKFGYEKDWYEKKRIRKKSWYEIFWVRKKIKIKFELSSA